MRKYLHLSSLHTFPILIIDFFRAPHLIIFVQMLLVNPSVESYRVDEDGKPIQSSEHNNTEADLEQVFKFEVEMEGST